MVGELKGLIVALYARFSSDAQREASIEDQLRRCREHVEMRGGVVSDELMFVDRAASGAGIDRPGYERMMRVVTAKPRQVDVIVVEDLSRLGRSAADLFTLQRLLEFLEVRLLGVADGIDTAAAHTKLTFGMKSVISDIYLVELGDKTRRGLEGRARSGFATGGVPFGYGLKQVSDSDSKVIGSEIIIVEDEADIIRRIFKMYLEGSSFVRIARKLNASGVAPPRVYAKRRRTGWKDTSIRAILHNESYTGVWTWGKRRWKKAPGTNKRRPLKGAHPIVSQRPHLRIIDDETWDAVQARLRAVAAHYSRTATGAPKGRSVPGRSSSYLFSSLLVCGVCGGKMVISGGSSKAYYRCEGYSKRGVCKNGLSVPEPVVRANLLDELRRRLTSDKGITHARKQIAERLGALVKERDSERRERETRVVKIERQVEKLVEFIADGNASRSVAEKLKELEKQLETERRLLKAVEERTVAPVRLPSQDDVLKIALDLEPRLLADVTKGREELRRLFREGKVTLIPQPGGYYIARSEILPLTLLTPVSKGDEVSRYSAISCAGRI